MTRLPAARFAEVLQYVQFSACWWSPDAALPLRCADWPRGRTWWFRGPHADLADSVRWLDERRDTEIRIGLPWARPSAGCVSQASLLWARVDGPDQLARANRFRPRPAIVLSEGASRRLLLWPLEETLSWAEVKAANRKIAYALRAVQKWSDPDLLWFVAPGTCVRVGRSRPLPVRVARLTIHTFTAQQVAGRLREAPDVRWWERAG